MLEALYRLDGRVCRNVLQMLLLLMVSMPMLAAAQDERPPVIDAENITRLGSVRQIDFADDAAPIENGRFALRDDGERVALADTQGNIHILDTDGLPVGFYGVQGNDMTLANPLAITFGPADSIASIHTDGDQFFAVKFDYVTGDLLEARFPEALLDVWWSGSSVMLETETAVAMVSDNVLLPLSRTFRQDTDSIIRIGRIAPPLAITVTEDGRVKRWNMETGEITAEVQVEGALPIYGQMNAGGEQYLAWRDPLSAALHLLDFATGEDRVIVELNGTYIPFIFLSANADVIIGVNVDDKPVVVAWDVATGQQYNLGAYRTCSRPPDMVRLSADGSTLVIGCDAGLDIWRIE